MNVKTATLLAAIGAILSLLLDVVNTFSPGFVSSHYETLRYVWVLTSASYANFFIALYLKQSRG